MKLAVIVTYIRTYIVQNYYLVNFYFCLLDTKVIFNCNSFFFGVSLSYPVGLHTNARLFY